MTDQQKYEWVPNAEADASLGELWSRRFVNEYGRTGTVEEIRQMLDDIWNNATSGDDGLLVLGVFGDAYDRARTALRWKYEHGTFGNHCERLGLKIGPLPA